MSVVGVSRIVSCILHNEELTDVSLDPKPSACVGHEAWRSEGLPPLPSAVVRDGWDAVLKHLRQVCIRLLRLLFRALQFPPNLPFAPSGHSREIRAPAVCCANCNPGLQQPVRRKEGDRGH